MALLFKLLLQRRQRGLGGGHFRFLLEHIGTRSRTGFKLISHDHELIRFRLNDLECRLYLSTQRRFLDRRGHDVRGQRQISGLEPETLIFGKRRSRFDCPPLAAENIGGVGDIHRGLPEIERLRRSSKAELRRRECLTRKGAGCVNGRQHGARLRIQSLLGLPQGGLRRLQVRIGAKRFCNQCVDLLRMEHPPPLARDVAAIHERLPRATTDGGSRRRCERFLRRKAGDRRSWRGRKIRPNGASGQH